MTPPVLKRPDDLGMADAFVRDRHLEAKFRALVEEYKVQTVVETGTWRGYTARRLAEFVPRVITIESNRELHEMSWETLEDMTNVFPVCDDSRRALKDIYRGRWIAPPALYYLDAHWGDDWPLFEELDIIAAHDPRCLIVVHDIQVPGKDFKFDTYNGRPLTLELIRPHLDKLRFPWKYEYNTESEGHRVGCVFICPA